MVDKLILIGYMGVGKSTIGKLLAQKLEKSFFDLDELIQIQEGKSIQALFAEKGELYFRKVEHEKLKDLISTQSNFVLSVGGGTPCYANNHELYQRKDCLSFYLKADVNTLENRLKNQRLHRPILQEIPDETINEFIAKQVFERSFYYQQADYVVSVQSKSPTQLTQEIIELLV